MNLKKSQSNLNKLLTTVVFATAILASTPANSAVTRGPDGRWYGNICVTQMGAYYVNWQPVGSICYVPGHNMHGFIANT